MIAAKSPDKSVSKMMEDIIAALPETSIPDVALFYNGEKWEVLAGGHYAVGLGEWCGDFCAEGSTAEDTLAACLQNIKDGFTQEMFCAKKYDYRIDGGK